MKTTFPGLMADYFIEESREISRLDLERVVGFLSAIGLPIPSHDVLLHAWVCGVLLLIMEADF